MIAHVDLLDDLLTTGGAVEQNCDPMGFVHMVSGEDAGLLDEGFDEVGVGFEVDDTNVLWGAVTDGEVGGILFCESSIR